MLGALRPIKTLIAGARIAGSNPRVQREMAIASRYASRANLGSGGQAALKTGQLLGSGGRRIARVYSSPAGQLGVNAAFFAPMFIPMGGDSGQSSASDFTTGMPYQSMPLQPVDNYDPMSAGYISMPSIAPNTGMGMGLSSTDVISAIANQENELSNTRARYQQMGASPFSY